MSRFMQWAGCAALVIIAVPIPHSRRAPAIGPVWVECSIVILQQSSRTIRQGTAGHRFPSQTENAINYPQSKGVWQSVTALGKLQRRYFDPVSGQAGYYGTVMEGSETAIVTVRLRVENSKLTEAEWYIARADDPGLSGPRRAGGPPANNYNPDYLTQNPPRQAAVPAAQRVDRATLGRIVDSYFDSITSHDGANAITHKGCGRVENGTPAPGGAFLPPLPRREGAPPPAGAAAWHGRWPAAAGSGNQRLRCGTPELQRGDGRGAPDSAHRRGSADRARDWRVHPQAGDRQHRAWSPAGGS